MKPDFINKCILLTGATGLIGKAIIHRLLLEKARIIAVVRDVEKAKLILGNSPFIEYVKADIVEVPIKNYGADYIIHAASNTSSRAFVETPVDIINTNYQGTLRMLEIARQNPIKSFVFLSTMEVYGAPETDELINEIHGTNINTMSVRSSYPESKRACELLCKAYETQYNIPAKVVRLTQTIGPGVQLNDGRIFAELARCVIEKRDIVLHTKGETKRSYLYTEDAVDAVLTVLLVGKPGEAYNAANEDTYCSIYDMAEMVATRIADNEIEVRIEESDDALKRGFAPTLKMNLDTTRLRKLGWKPNTSLEQMFSLMIEDMKKGNK